MGNQSIRAKLLVPEFECFVHSEVELQAAGHKLLASPLPGGDSTETPSNKRLRKTFKYGVRWKPEDFLQCAKQVAHPRSPQKMLPEYMKEAVFQVPATSALEASKHRLQVILAIRAKCNELRIEEDAWKKSLDEEARAVLACKHISLWKYLLRTTMFDDMGVVDMVASGIPLHGSHSAPPNFPPDWKPAEYSMQELLATVEWQSRQQQI